MNETAIGIQHIEILDHYHIRAKKSFGQNFLTDDFFLNEITHAVDLKDANVIEIGPGYGALTEKLLSMSPKSLTLIELDPDMISILTDRINPNHTFAFEGDITPQIIHQDILKLRSLPHTPAKIIANIPYYITSPILTHTLQILAGQVSEMVIMMQKEVAEKIVHPRKHSFLSLSCHLFCDDIDLITLVPRKAFIPAPKVDSAVLRFRIKSYSREIWGDAQAILELASSGFREPRKKLISNLAKYGHYTKDSLERIFELLGLSQNTRAEELSTDDWQRLYQTININK